MFYANTKQMLHWVLVQYASQSNFITNHNPELIKEITVYNTKYNVGGMKYECAASLNNIAQNPSTVKSSLNVQWLLAFTVSLQDWNQQS